MYILVSKGNIEEAKALTKRNAIKRAKALARRHGVIDVCAVKDEYAYHILSVYKDGHVSRV